MRRPHFGHRHCGQLTLFNLGYRATAREQGNTELHRDGELDRLESRQCHLHVHGRSSRLGELHDSLAGWRWVVGNDDGLSGPLDDAELVA